MSDRIKSIKNRNRYILQEVARYLTDQGYDVSIDMNVMYGCLDAKNDGYYLDISSSNKAMNVWAWTGDNICALAPIDVHRRVHIDRMAVKTVESIKRFIHEANVFLVNNHEEES